MKLASFDIFDTVLIRKCGKPENIFYLLAYRLYPEDKALREDFLLWRKGAEAEVHKLLPDKEVKLIDIYALPSLAGFYNYSREEMMRYEREVESDNLVANPEILSIIQSKRANDFRICFISDMYLDSGFLTTILCREGCCEEGERVYVSCEWDATKATGVLYDKIRSTLRPDDWLHYGDNKLGDVVQARCRHIKAVWVKTPFSAVETHFCELLSGSRYEYEASILAGMLRTARLKSHNDNNVVIAADYVAPAYIPYVYDILNVVQHRGIKRLYFLSRDGYVLMKIAEAFQPKDIELRYLFVSRKSLILPYMANGDEDRYLQAIDLHTLYNHSVDKLLSQLDTDRDELRTYGIEFPYIKIKNKKQERDFLDKLFHSEFTVSLQERAEHSRQLFLDYLRQEGVTNGERTAMVDVGWLGTSRLIINSVLREIGCPDTEFFYYGTRTDVFHSQCGRYNSYFRPAKVTACATVLIENYFSASPYPSTAGYVRTETGNVKPCFIGNNNYGETAITMANVDTSAFIVKLITDSRLNFSDVYYEWAKYSLNSLINLHHPINLSPLMNCHNFDNLPFVRQLTFTEIFRLVFLGDNITGFDKASLLATTGRPLLPFLWHVSLFTNKIRSILYYRLRLKLKKK
jgi:hypothetical protein